MSGQIEYRCSRCAITFEVDYANGGESPLLGVECLCLDCRKPKTKKVMSTTPQRYDPSDKNVAVMIGITDGDYVLFSDYEAQQTIGGKLPYAMHFLIQRAVEYPRAWEPGSPRWSAVGSVFQVGCNNAIAICKAFGFDPNEVKPYEDGFCGDEPTDENL